MTPLRTARKERMEKDTKEPEQSGFIHLRRHSMTEIFAILLVIEVIMIIRGTIQGRMLPWVLALIATLILIAGTVGRIV
jgi:hypothetical protein